MKRRKRTSIADREELQIQMDEAQTEAIERDQATKLEKAIIREENAYLFHTIDATDLQDIVTNDGALSTVIEDLSRFWREVPVLERQNLMVEFHSGRAEIIRRTPWSEDRIQRWVNELWQRRKTRVEQLRADKEATERIEYERLKAKFG